MLEKLLENWLDSAGERTYQQAFVQMLSAQGYRVVHSTRHAALEFGKDVLAVAPDRKGCAYQLKGNPGSRLGLNEFRGLQPQLVQMMSQGIVFPGFPAGAHRSYLVTNGFFDEEVQRAADDLNRLRYKSRLELISRGHLLTWAKDLGASLWPSELSDTQALLQLFLADPADLLPVKQLGPLIEKLVGLDDESRAVKRAEIDRRIPAAALLIGIATSRFAEKGNHLAVAWAWSLFVVMSLGSLERHGLALKGPPAKALALAEAAITNALIELWGEVDSREHLVEGSPLTDPEVIDWRLPIVLSAMTSLALKHEQSPCLADAEYTKLREWLLREDHMPRIWGEGAVAHLLPWFVWLQRHDATMRSDIRIMAAVKFVVTCNRSGSPTPLANPYVAYDEEVRRRLSLGEMHTLRDSPSGSSHTALLLFHMLIRTNLKSSCREVWPELTKLTHRRTAPDASWEYCRLVIGKGVDETKLLPLEGDWAMLRKEAMKDSSDTLPTSLGQRPWLLGIWWQIAPQRLTPEASRTFANSLVPSWGA